MTKHNHNIFRTIEIAANHGFKFDGAWLGGCVMRRGARGTRGSQCFRIFDDGSWNLFWPNDSIDDFASSPFASGNGKNEESLKKALASKFKRLSVSQVVEACKKKYGKPEHGYMAYRDAITGLNDIGFGVLYRPLKQAVLEVADFVSVGPNN